MLGFFQIYLPKTLVENSIFVFHFTSSEQPSQIDGKTHTDYISYPGRYIIYQIDHVLVSPKFYIYSDFHQD